MGLKLSGKGELWRTGFTIVLLKMNGIFKWYAFHKILVRGLLKCYLPALSSFILIHFHVLHTVKYSFVTVTYCLGKW